MPTLAEINPRGYASIIENATMSSGKRTWTFYPQECEEGTRSMTISDMKPFQLHPRSILRILLQITSLLVVLQAITVIVLQIVSVQRRRLQKPSGFPHPKMPEACVGENKLKIYNYGRDLYE